jgi:hypothetical protein
MTALRKTIVVETRETWTPVVITGTGGKAKEAPAATARRGLFTNMALFLMAPFVGLAYAMLLPFVGLGMLLWFGARTLLEPAKVKRAMRFGRKMLLVVAMPFAGLAYLIAMPFIGCGMLAWFGAKAVLAPAPAA